MKKTLIKIASIAIMALGLTGCGQKFTEDGLLLNSNSSMNTNSKTKVYYKDISKDLVIDANKRLVDDLNNKEIIPSVWKKIINPEKTTSYYDARYVEEKNTANNKISGGKFILSDDGMSITYEKNYTSAIDFFTDCENFNVYIKEKLNNSELRDRYLTSVIIPDKISLKKNKLIFSTKYTFLYNLLHKDIKKQIELGGWQIVDSPEKADKEIYFELSRDYYSKELDELRRSKKGIRFVSLESGNKFSIQGNNNSNHVVVGQSAMNLASASNSNLASAGIGLGVSTIFSLLGPSKEDISGSFVSLRIIDKIKNTDNVKLYDSFVPYHEVDIIYNLLKKINKTINLDPESIEYNIN
ncbi:hypothetical protein ACOTWR_06115 [Aliarcobacter butzleri]|uniref:hypothetical protein n=1 Tax=Aliarcobacter butzleri TaxID=28197 RepID=UPI0021B16B5D|nr:hypothetical protein [Aliarcobacter butzleri]MCT7563151.1 hypothetical protein [Aliarcobacter butzleri]